MILETENLKLVVCDQETLQEAIKGDEHLAAHLGVTIADQWTEFGEMALHYSLDRITESAEQQGWWTHLPVNKKDNTLIGTGGFKGKPSGGIVEIGYEIAPSYRNKGLATEFAKSLAAHAFSTGSVTKVIAHTLAEVNASTGVLSKCGFKRTDEINDPDDGLIWRWELSKPV